MQKRPASLLFGRDVRVDRWKSIRLHLQRGLHRRRCELWASTQTRLQLFVGEPRNGHASNTVHTYASESRISDQHSIHANGNCPRYWLSRRQSLLQRYYWYFQLCIQTSVFLFSNLSIPSLATPRSWHLKSFHIFSSHDEIIYWRESKSKKIFFLFKSIKDDFFKIKSAKILWYIL